MANGQQSQINSGVAQRMVADSVSDKAMAQQIVRIVRTGNALNKMG